ncbi:MAG: Lpp/OprI family alanine-zipper lipoprotein [Thiogranum sp.]
MLRNRAILVLAMSVLVGMAGCATTSDIDALRAEVQQANDTANSAAARADAASREAAAAAQTANEARTSADEANSKIDRMFKKSMYK